MTAERKDAEIKPFSKMNKAELLEACKVAGVNPPADATNKALVALLEAPTDENAEALAQAEKLEKEVKAQVKKGHFVAEGKSLIAGKKGSFDAGAPITAEDLGGEENLKRHVENGNIIKVG